MPLGSSEATRTGVAGPSATAILPPSDHLVETTKAGAAPPSAPSSGDAFKPSHGSVSNVGSTAPLGKFIRLSIQPVLACETSASPIAPSNAVEATPQRRK